MRTVTFDFVVNSWLCFVCVCVVVSCSLDVCLRSLFLGRLFQWMGLPESRGLLVCHEDSDSQEHPAVEKKPAAKKRACKKKGPKLLRGARAAAAVAAAAALVMRGAQEGATAAGAEAAAAGCGRSWTRGRGSTGCSRAPEGVDCPGCPRPADRPGEVRARSAVAVDRPWLFEVQAPASWLRSLSPHASGRLPGPPDPRALKGLPPGLAADPADSLKQAEGRVDLRLDYEQIKCSGYVVVCFFAVLPVDVVLLLCFVVLSCLMSAGLNQAGRGSEVK